MILRNYDAFRRGDIDGAVWGWDQEVMLRPLPHGPSYHGLDQIRAFLQVDINELAEFDFRVYSILEQQAEHALIFGRYSVRQGGGIVEKGIFWIARLHDERITSFEAFENVGEAFAEFKRRLGRP